MAGKLNFSRCKYPHYYDFIDLFHGRLLNVLKQEKVKQFNLFLLVLVRLPFLLKLNLGIRLSVITIKKGATIFVSVWAKAEAIILCGAYLPLIKL